MVYKYLCDESVVNTYSNFTFENIKWSYSGEGSRHLVISLPEKQLVIRFCKHSEQEISEIDEHKRYYFIFTFHYMVMVPLFGKVYSILPIIGKIRSEEIAFLNDIPLRPSYRNKYNIKYGFVEIYPNSTLLPILELQNVNKSITQESFMSSTFNYINLIMQLMKNSEISSATKSLHPVISVEIKPKQGWIPLSERKFPKCIFCMHQYFKLSSHMATSKSNYCPLDLFSGNTKRMQAAIRHLIEAPQNNLKIFKDGELVYGEEKKSNINDVLLKIFEKKNSEIDRDHLIEQFCELTVQALKSKFSSSSVDFVHIESYSHSKCKSYLWEYENKIKLLSNALACESCNWSYQTNTDTILGKILEIQKLDQIGLEDVFNYYKANLGTADYGYIDKISPENGYSVYQQLALNIVECYTLSSVAKDCSVFVTMKKISPSDLLNENVLHWQNEKYIYNNSVADIGPKPLNCIEKHIRRNVNIINSCCKYFNIE